MKWTRTRRATTGGTRAPHNKAHPVLEVLEDRRVPSTTGTVNAPAPPNAPPAAFSIKVSDFVNTPISTPLAALDTNGDTLTYRIVSGPTHGTARLQGNVIVYTPAAQFQGTDSVQYVANDGRTDSAPAVLQYTVQPPWAGARLISFTSGGLTRTYVLHVPTNLPANRPAPLVVALGGSGTTGMLFAKQTGLVDMANQQGFVVAFPDAVANFWANGIGFVTDQMGINDVAFLSQVLDDVAARVPIDSTREYMMGHSFGGMMTERAGMAFSSRLAAIGIFAGPIPQALHDQPGLRSPISVIYMQGTADPVVPYAGGQSPAGLVESAPQSVEFWKSWNRQVSAAKVTALPNSNLADGSTITAYDTTSGGSGIEVLFYQVVGGGHGIPGIPASPNLGLTNMDINGPAQVLKFFQAHPKRLTPVQGGAASSAVPNQTSTNLSAPLSPAPATTSPKPTSGVDTALAFLRGMAALESNKTRLTPVSSFPIAPTPRDTAALDKIWELGLSASI